MQNMRQDLGKATVGVSSEKQSGRPVLWQSGASAAAVLIDKCLYVKVRYMHVFCGAVCTAVQNSYAAALQVWHTLRL